MSKKIEITVVVDLQAITPYELNLDEDVNVHDILNKAVRSSLEHAICNQLGKFVGDHVQKQVKEHEIGDAVRASVKERVNAYLDTPEQQERIEKRIETAWQDAQDRVVKAITQKAYDNTRNRALDALADSIILKGSHVDTSLATVKSEDTK